VGEGGFALAENAPGRAALESELARQASMLAYIDAFWFFAATAAAVLPLILLVRWKRFQSAR
jgi:DHA2 family multidrug resistance protein